MSMIDDCQQSKKSIQSMLNRDSFSFQLAASEDDLRAVLEVLDRNMKEGFEVWQQGILSSFSTHVSLYVHI